MGLEGIVSKRLGSRYSRTVVRVRTVAALDVLSCTRPWPFGLGDKRLIERAN
jgi:hypothetical protein